MQFALEVDYGDPKQPVLTGYRCKHCGFIEPEDLSRVDIEELERSARRKSARGGWD